MGGALAHTPELLKWNLPMTVRVLVTGFSIFPGAPHNPSERLIRMLEERRPDFGAEAVLETALFETSYQAAPRRLAEIGRSCPPDIALHFGLARTANGFRLERSARNLVSSPLPDAVGYIPEAPRICDGPDSHASSLPLDAIREALAAKRIPAEFSDDAGGYVCNFTFYHSLGGLTPGFRPPMAGFIHIPYLEDQVARIPDSELLPRLSEEMLWEGALVIIRMCIAAFAQPATGEANTTSHPAKATVA